jgi:hypothetical protein
MRRAIIIHQDGDKLAFVCESCYDENNHKRFAHCEFQQTPQRCAVCGRFIGWEEDRKITPCEFRAVRM